MELRHFNYCVNNNRKYSKQHEPQIREQSTLWRIKQSRVTQSTQSRGRLIIS